MKLFSSFNKKLFSIFNGETESKGLSIFRILYSLILFSEMFQLYYFRHLIFEQDPFSSFPFIDSTLFIFWFISVFCLLVGLFTKTAAIINYILCLIVYASLANLRYLYALDFSIIGINFLLIVIPVSKSFSVDRLWEKLKYSTIRKDFIPKESTRAIYPIIIFFVALGISYFESAIHKFSSPLWKSGLGFWVPASLPQFTYTDFSFLLNNEFLSKSIGYLILLFEIVFVFLFWIKSMRIPLIITGIIFHLNIALIYPIPIFGLFGAFCYVLIIPSSFWNKIAKKIINKKPSLVVYYDEECPLCNRTKIIITHVDWFQKIAFKGVQRFHRDEVAFKGIGEEELLENIYSVNSKGKIFIGFKSYVQMFRRIWFLSPVFILLQLPIISFFAAKIYSLVARNRLREKCDETTCFTSNLTPPNEDEIKIFRNLTLTQVKFFVVKMFLIYVILSYALTFFIPRKGVIQRATDEVKKFNTEMLGITSHGLFMDTHYKNYKYIIAITFLDKKTNTEKWLPIIKENGQTGYYITGRQWCFWTFRVNSPNSINPNNLELGIKEYTKFWLRSNYPDLQAANFMIKVKTIDTINNWESNFLHAQMEKPWINAGTVTWESNNCLITLPDFKTLN